MPTILTKRSNTPGAVPATANLTNAAGGAELAVNTADKRLFSINSSSAIIEVGTNPSSLTCADASFTVARVGSLTISSLSLTNVTVTSATVTTLTGTSANITNISGTSLTVSTATLSGGTANGVLYLNGSKVATSGTALVFDGTNLGIGTSSPAYKLDVRGVTASGNGTITTGFSYDSRGLVGTFSNHSLGFLTNGAVVGTWDTSGNLGLGVTPSAWTGSGGKNIEIGATGNAIFGSASLTTYIYNANFDSSWKYSRSDFASRYEQQAGQHRWYTAPSGTAGNAISFTQALTLDASGRLLIGLTSGTEALSISSSDIYQISFKNSSGSAAAFGADSSSNLRMYANGAERARITAAGSVVAGGSVALATTATDGFLYVPTCAGTPTGTPTAITGMAPIVVNTTNNKLYFYSGGAWRDAGP